MTLPRAVITSVMPYSDCVPPDTMRKQDLIENPDGAVFGVEATPSFQKMIQATYLLMT